MDPWGATEATPAYRTASSAFVDSAPMTSGRSSTTSRSARQGARWRWRWSWRRARGGDRRRPDVLPVFVSLTSGDRHQEIVDLADGAGGMPVLRGTRRPSPRSPARVVGAATRRATGRRAGRRAWPALAADAPRYGPRRPGSARPRAGQRRRLGCTGRRPAVPSASRWSGCAPPVIPSSSSAVDGRDRRCGRRPPPRASAGRSSSSSMRPRLAHKSDLGGVVVGIGDEAAVRAAFEAVIDAGHRHGRSAASSSSPGARPASSSSSGRAATAVRSARRSSGSAASWPRRSTMSPSASRRSARPTPGHARRAPRRGHPARAPGRPPVESAPWPSSSSPSARPSSPSRMAGGRSQPGHRRAGRARWRSMP